MKNLHLISLLVSVVGIVGCGSAAMSDGGTTGPQTAGEFAAADTTQSATKKDSSGGGNSTGQPWGGGADAASSDIAGWGGSSDASTGGGGMVPGPGDLDGQGIGLKPGGAQDIGYFRLLLKTGKVPKPGDMTIEGWLNEHDTVLPKPLKDRLVTLHAMGAIVQAAGQKAEAVLQLGLNSAASLADVKTTLSLTLVIDNSGSMAGDKMKFVKSGLHALADKLPKGTDLAIYTFSATAKKIWPLWAQTGIVGSADDVAGVHMAIDSIFPDAGTNIHAGLEAGVTSCASVPTAKFAQKRVMLLSDGQATVGNTNPAAIEMLATSAVESGCTVSTVGVGLDFDAPLMTKLAQKGGGTGWFLQDAEAAKNVFVQDLETMLVSVAQKLWIQFKPAPGWKVLDIYGFDWVEKDGVVKITGTKKPPVDPGTDPGTEPTPDPGTEPVAMPTLYASSRNGLVLARIAAPDGLEPAQILDLALATVTYGYTESKDANTAQFDVPVKVPGLTQIPDGGLYYFADPGVRRAWVLLQDGLTLQAAILLHANGSTPLAVDMLTAAVVRHDAHVAMMAADLPVYDASAPDLADARALLVDLGKLLAAPASP